MKNILISVLGKSPQVITETLYFLHIVRKPPIAIDQNHIITTKKGYQIFSDVLTSEPDGKFYKLCNDYKLERAKIIPTENTIYLLKDKNGEPLHDIRSVEDNIMAGNQIIDIIHRLTEDQETALFASIAGGRKTMSVYLGFGMQLFGREQDMLLHVLVPRKYEKDTSFFYPKPSQQNYIRIDCSEIPFIRLSEITPDLRKDRHSYASIINSIQQALEAGLTYPQIRINTIKPIIEFGEIIIKLPPLQMAIWKTFADQKISNCIRPVYKVCGECIDCYVSQNKTRAEFPEYFVKEIIQNYQKYCKWNYSRKNHTIQRIREETVSVIWENRSRINKHLNEVAGKRLSERALEIKSVGKPNKKYGIVTDKTKLKYTG